MSKSKQLLTESAIHNIYQLVEDIQDQEAIYQAQNIIKDIATLKARVQQVEGVGNEKLLGKMVGNNEPSNQRVKGVKRC